MSDKNKPEAAAQKVEQPAVEPQKCTCKMPDFQHSICPVHGAGSTRPEMPPANELKALEALEQMVASARTHYSRNHDDSPPFPFEVVLSVANYSILQSATKVVAEALRERAASVQQEPPQTKVDSVTGKKWMVNSSGNVHEYCPDCRGECSEYKEPAAPHTQEPLNCHRCFEVSNQVLEHVNVLENANDSEEYYSAAFELRKILPSLDQFIKLEIEDALKAAAPRTQGRELAEQIVSTVFPSMDRECAARYIQQIDGILLAQTRTQPAPKCPKCGSPASIYWMIGHREGKCNGVDCGYSSVHWEQFFTALPEVTKEEK